MINFVQETWFIWALLIVFGFPFVSAILGQIAFRLERNNSIFAKPLRISVNIVLPIIVAFLIVRFVADTDSTSVANKLLLSTVLVLAIYVLVALFNTAFFEAAPTGSWRNNTPKLLRDVVLLLMVALGFSVILAQVWEQDVTGLLAALGVGSVILGFALQETLGNVMLGLSLLLERPYGEGDEVAIGDTEGLVIEINWRATRLEVDGDIVTVPHSVAAGETIVNLSRPGLETPVMITVGFGYELPPNRVRDVLREAVENAEGAKIEDDKPELGVFVTEFADSAINYSVSFLAESAEVKERVIDRVMTLIWYGAQRNNLNIPFPIRTVYNFDGLKSAPDPGQLSPGALTASFADRVFDPRTLDDWLTGARLIHFAKGETLVRQGEQAPGMLVLVSGEALLKIRGPKGDSHTLFEVGRGEFIGEATAFSGADCPYTAVAETDVQVLCISAQDLVNIVERRPSFGMDIGQVIDARRNAIKSALGRQGVGSKPAAVGRSSSFDEQGLLR